MENITEKAFDSRNLSEKFGAIDYVVFIGMLGVSAGIGVVYGCFGKNQNSTSEFLMAGRNMGTFPVTMSLLASFISAIALLGIPAEVYLNGTMYWVICFSLFLVMGASAHLYLPVFYNLQLTSAYEYLELRFSKPVRMLASSMFILQMTIYMSIVVYAPALALSQVTGLNVYGCVSAIFAIVIFYTALGGMKAVMWTDVVQTIIMFGAIFAVIVKGTFDLGGFGDVWRIANEGGRIEFFNVNPDPRERHTVWSLFFGAYFTWVAIYGVNQAQVQRYLTLPSMERAQKAIWLNVPGLVGVLSLCCYAGLVIFAKYAGCDPLASKRVSKADQLFPLFVMDTMGDLHGFPGLFVAGVFSGALSTVSSGLNSLAAITLEDFVKYFYPNMKEKTSTNVSKVLAVVYGLIAFVLVFAAEQLGGILQAALSIFGIIGGPVLGVFTLGMCFPWANSKGAFGGTIISFVFMMWLGIGANVSVAKKLIVNRRLPVRLDECLYGNSTLPVPPTGSSGGLLEFYRVSYMWYSLLGCFGTILAALVISYLTEPQDPRTLDPRLIRPVVDNFVKAVVPQKVRDFVHWDLGTNKTVQHKWNFPKMSSNGVNSTRNGINGINNPAFHDKNVNGETQF